MKISKPTLTFNEKQAKVLCCFERKVSFEEATKGSKILGQMMLNVHVILFSCATFRNEVKSISSLKLINSISLCVLCSEAG